MLLYIFITAFTSLLSNVSLWPYMKRYVVKVDFRKLSFKRHFKETLVYFIPTIATSVYTVLDKTLLGLITSDVAQNGYYQQAEKIINLAKSVVLKKYRLLKDLTQEQLAAQVGVRRETIMRLEKAQYNPSLKLAIDISRVVEAPIEEIFVFK